MSSVETVTIKGNADATLDEANPTLNYGIGVAISSNANSKRGLMRFATPNFSGAIKRVWFEVNCSNKVGTTVLTIHLVEIPQNILWKEGTSTGGVDPIGCSWNDYAKDNPWDTPGGDFNSDPIAIQELFNGDNTIELTKTLDLNPDTTYAFLLKFGDETSAGSIDTTNRSSGNYPKLKFEIEIDGFDTPILTAEPINSIQIDISWNKSQLADDNFTHYLLEQSDTGVGGWTTLATITDKDTVKYEHTGLVVQGDVDDYDEDSDTYPNGRTKYYRVSVVSDTFGATGYGTADATTIPAIRPVSLTFTPKSKYWDSNFIDDNRAYKPYGVQVIPEWYDENDITETNYLDKLNVEAYFRQASTWPGAASETQDFSPVDFDTGGIIEGDTGYKPYKIKGKIYDTGGLYRKATTDKSNEQFDAAWPAPCPIAIPDGAYADAPPALFGRPFSAGALVPIDLSAAGQQIGEDIFVEDFLGAAPDDDGKWRWLLGTGVGAPIYTTGVLSAPIIQSTLNTTGAQALKFIKILRDEGSIENSYNKWLSKYTGGYRVRYVFRLDSWDRTLALRLNINSGLWTKDFSDGIRRGYSVEFSSSNNNLKIYRTQVLGGNAASLLLTYDLSTDAPLRADTEEKFFLVDIIISP